MQIISNHLCFTTFIPEKIKALIPETRTSQNLVGVPFSLQNMQVLQDLGLHPPSPVLQDYKFMGRFAPYEHQRETCEFLTLNRRAYLLSGMGTGKTLSALWSIDYLKSLGIVRKVLIVSPLSTLSTVWADAIFLDFPHRTWTVLHGSAAKRRELLRNSVDYYIINHHGVEILKDELAKRKDIDLIIIDELATYRNMRTGLWRSLKHILTPEKWVWGLTGSPTPQAPTDAYAQARLITPERYTGSFTRFKQTTMYQASMFKWLARPGAEDIVANILRPSIRHSLRDCVDLPPTIYQDRHAELSPQQKKHYLELLQKCVTEIDGSQVTAVNAAVLLAKLVQAACGVIYGVDGSIIKMDFGPRLQVVKEIIDECNEPVILFVPLTAMLHELHKELTDAGYKFEVIEGATNVNKRSEIFRRVQSGTSGLDGIIANPQAMSHGVTLTQASTIVWYTAIYSNETYEQANARIVRPGQKNVTNIIHVQGTPVEKKIFEALKQKGKMQKIILDLIQKGETE
jgi:SNF2 family DNA or RNA helicase